MSSIVTRQTDLEHGNDAPALGVDVVAAARLMAAQHPFGGVAGLAAACNIPTLAKKLDPRQDSHHLRLDEAVLLQQVAGRADVLHAMADVLGYAVVPKGEDRQSSLIERVGALSGEFGDLLKVVHTSVADGVVTPNERLHIEREAAQLQAAIDSLVKTVKAL